MFWEIDRIEGTQMGDRTTDKMWLVRHLEVTRQLVLEDLRVVKVSLKCFAANRIMHIMLLHCVEITFD